MTISTFVVGGDIEVGRLGLGAMRITGLGIWGPPRDRVARERYYAEPSIWRPTLLNRSRLSSIAQGAMMLPWWSVPRTGAGT